MFSVIYVVVQSCQLVTIEVLQVGQETCYNVPRLEPSKVKVDITLPEPVEKCQTRSELLDYFWLKITISSYLIS